MKGLMMSDSLLVTRILDYAARWHPEQEVICRTTEGPIEASTWKDVHRRARQCSLALRKLGVREGDIVATLAWNTRCHLESWYGVMGLGAVCHTLNPRLFAADLEYIVNHAEDAVLMFDAPLAPLVAQLAPRLRSVRAFVVLTDRGHMPQAPSASGSPPVLCYEELLAAEAGAEPGFAWVDVDENDACGLCYTSGTTGRPKGVLYSHRANYLHALMMVNVDSAALGSRSRVLAIVPMFHANSWGLVFAAPLMGACLVLPGPHLDGPSVYHLLERYRCDFSAAVPTVCLALLQHLEATRQRLTHLRLVCVGGSACPPSTIQKLEEVYGVEVRHQWGMTELCPMGTIGGLKGTLGALTKEQRLAIKSKQGRPSLFVDFRLVDREGRVLPHDGRAQGELQVRGLHVAREYFRHKGSHDVTADGWFNTGDMANIDQYGHVQLTDRSKDVIKSGGEWISSIDLENVAVGHPQVLEAAVIAIPHPKWDERPLLILVPHPAAPPPTPEDVLAFMQGKVAKWWLPDNCVLVKEIPHTATGKISKLELRKQFKDYRLQRSRL
ncbi:hypothetical protein WJX81_008061 [Elliptochloris bilobata]|uniref:Uncharacterized protein n=1 Tax=Elliptochloris bilobata TaxID=381761 RepID=A0AAW1RNK3_9CHLO